MLAMGVAERCPLSIGLVDEASSALIDGEVLSKSEIGLEVPVSVLVNLTPFVPVQ